jgi:hypothetical protein
MSTSTALNTQTFGRLTVDHLGVMKPTPSGKNRNPYLDCYCSCAPGADEVDENGNGFDVPVVRVRADRLTSGHTLSCGCLLREMRAAQKTHSPRYTDLVKWAVGVRAEILGRYKGKM